MQINTQFQMVGFGLRSTRKLSSEGQDSVALRYEKLRRSVIAEHNRDRQQTYLPTDAPWAVIVPALSTQGLGNLAESSLGMNLRPYRRSSREDESRTDLERDLLVKLTSKS